MAKTAAKIWAIAHMAFEETLRRKVLYIVGFLIILLISAIGSGTALMRMATEAGEFETAASIRAQFVQTVLGMWSAGGMFLAVFLGAVAVSSEINAKTIVNVLSRPIERAGYLTGRWAGTLIFLVGFQSFGILIALVIAMFFDVRYTPTLWLGLVEMFVNVLFFSGVSLSLSVFMPPVPAGACALLLSMLPSMIEGLTKYPLWFIRLPATAVYYLSPAVMPVELVSESFTRQVLNPSYRLYVEVLAENLLYAMAVFALGCFVFSRKELRLR